MEMGDVLRELQNVLDELLRNEIQGERMKID